MLSTLRASSYQEDGACMPTLPDANVRQSQIVKGDLCIHLLQAAGSILRKANSVSSYYVLISCGPEEVASGCCSADEGTLTWNQHLLLRIAATGPPTTHLTLYHRSVELGGGNSNSAQPSQVDQIVGYLTLPMFPSVLDEDHLLQLEIPFGMPFGSGEVDSVKTSNDPYYYKRGMLTLEMQFLSSEQPKTKPSTMTEVFELVIHQVRGNLQDMSSTQRPPGIVKHIFVDISLMSDRGASYITAADDCDARENNAASYKRLRLPYNSSLDTSTEVPRFVIEWMGATKTLGEICLEVSSPDKNKDRFIWCDFHDKADRSKITGVSKFRVVFEPARNVVLDHRANSVITLENRVTSAETITIWKKLFYLLDQNCNGYIDRNEFTNVFLDHVEDMTKTSDGQKLLQLLFGDDGNQASTIQGNTSTPSQEQITALFSIMDTNRDNEIEWGEYLRFLQRKQQQLVHLTKETEENPAHEPTEVTSGQKQELRKKHREDKRAIPIEERTIAASNQSPEELRAADPKDGALKQGRAAPKRSSKVSSAEHKLLKLQYSDQEQSRLQEQVVSLEAILAIERRRYAELAADRPALMRSYQQLHLKHQNELIQEQTKSKWMKQTIERQQQQLEEREKVRKNRTQASIVLQSTVRSKLEQKRYQGLKLQRVNAAIAIQFEVVVSAGEHDELCIEGTGLPESNSTNNLVHQCDPRSNLDSGHTPDSNVNLNELDEATTPLYTENEGDSSTISFTPETRGEELNDSDDANFSIVENVLEDIKDLLISQEANGDICQADRISSNSNENGQYGLSSSQDDPLVTQTRESHYDPIARVNSTDNVLKVPRSTNEDHTTFSKDNNVPQTTPTSSPDIVTITTIDASNPVEAPDDEQIDSFNSVQTLQGVTDLGSEASIVPSQPHEGERDTDPEDAVSGPQQAPEHQQEVRTTRNDDGDQDVNSGGEAVIDSQTDTTEKQDASTLNTIASNLCSDATGKLDAAFDTESAAIGDLAMPEDSDSDEQELQNDESDGESPGGSSIDSTDLMLEADAMATMQHATGGDQVPIENQTTRHRKTGRLDSLTLLTDLDKLNAHGSSDSTEDAAQ
ncbi:hypothetical protein PF010_g9844 [Phytophthora fragariae]|uniref:EF-hand domain-containing protein n=1 Tax=Phytophthora fragariae TaxID=53985 RepID=A0A6G0LAW6_9STRA|nr:hypothetical protein PF010_g9844 [Phytophthora fragariae]